ncbi:cytochrome c [Chelativorans sp. M5D2P16]|uniref:cytochrome c n=1 Tax=Chelativorans sp. M5D2P16 TaxID=3095678 RepID=UPI002ACA0F63|nr:cytochrome c [Chelativorans sp. M5D2P16]MDZ5698384.1 cytochrome c [Chelativorans sp. M5D2P16]
MLRNLLFGGAALAVLAGAAFWFLTRPEGIGSSALAAVGPGDATRGERIFWAGGCASCHARPEAEGERLLELSGGLELETAFGTFVAPNISPDPAQGIGEWDESVFVNAMLHGVSPEGKHYYPAFPYPSYARMETQDVLDLFAYLKTLPPAAEETAPHRLSFPYTMRRGIGLWKLIYMHEEPLVELPADAPEAVLRGRYLVEGPGHCGECHTPRSFAGGLQFERWLAGAPALEGDGRVPNITPSSAGIGSWSVADITYYLESGFTPDFDSVGGEMVAVQKNMARLPEEDRAAIAAYLKAVPEVEGE